MEVKRLADGSETWNAKTGKCSSCEINYLCIGVTSRAEAIQQVLQNAPPTYDVLILKEVRVDSYENGTAEISAVYEADDSGSGSDSGETDGNLRMSFDCSAGTKHVQVALEKNDVKYVENQEEKALYENAEIGWNGKLGDESAATGVDVPCANLRETYIKTISASRLSNARKRKYAELTGKVNSGSFMGWKKGEVMFMGCSYSAPVKGRDKVEVSFHFQIQLNETKAKVFDQTISKEGYEYIWVVTTQEKSGDSVTTKPKAIVVSKVVEHANFSELGL